MGSRGKTRGLRDLFPGNWSSRSLHQSRQRRQLIEARVRDRAEDHVAALPEYQMVSVADGGAGQSLIAGGPGEDVDKVLAVPIDHDGRPVAVDVVRTPADQRITLLCEVHGRRRNVGMARKPRLDRVP